MMMMMINVIVFVQNTNLFIIIFFALINIPLIYEKIKIPLCLILLCFVCGFLLGSSGSFFFCTSVLFSVLVSRMLYFPLS